jgi:hemoglobin/transferrin/lactoferrin receptor protein
MFRTAARTRLLLQLALGAGSASALAEPLTVVVLDADQRPVAGARVELRGTGLTAVTNSSGEADLAPPAARGSLRLRVSGYGYESVERALAPDASPETRLEIVLQPTPLRLNETVVVSAARELSRVIDLPRSASLVETPDLDRRMPRTTPEALTDTTGVFVQKTNHGGGSPIIRGLVGNHVLVLVDGVRLNNATFRLGPNQYLATVDPYAIERIEVVRGLGSVAYGSDALGGVVNIITARPSFNEDGLRLGGRLRPKLASSGMEVGARADVQASGRNFAFLGGVTHRDFGDLRAGRGIGVQAPSGYTEGDGDGHLLVRLGGRHLLHAVYQHVRQDDVPRYDQVQQRGFERYAFDPQVRQLAYVQLESSFDSRWVESLKVTPSFHRSSERRVIQRRGSSLQVRERDVVDALGFTVEARSRPKAGWSIVSGVESYRDHVASARDDVDLSTAVTVSRRGLYPDGATAHSLAAFTQSSLDWRSLVIDVGGRLTRYGVDASDASFGTPQISRSAAVGTAAVLWKLTSQHRLFAAVSQGFRAPNVDDLSTLGRFDFGVEVPSPDLLPERSINYEVGFKTRTSRTAAAVSVYRNDLSDLIERVRAEYEGSPVYEGQAVYRRANVGKAYVQGIEAEMEARLPAEVVAFGAFTYTYGQQTTVGEPMRRIPPRFGQVGLRREQPRGPSVEAALSFAGRQDRLAAGDKADHRINPAGTPGWSVLNVRAGYRFGSGLEVRAGLENVFDEAYRVHGSGVDGYGRYAWLGAHIRF